MRDDEAQSHLCMEVGEVPVLAVRNRTNAFGSGGRYLASNSGDNAAAG